MGSIYIVVERSHFTTSFLTWFFVPLLVAALDDLKIYVLDGLHCWRVEYSGAIQEPTAQTEGLEDMILADYRARSLSGRTPVKHRQKTILGLFISILSLLLATTPTLAEPKVTVIPSSLTVVGTRCLVFNFGCATVKRNLLVRTNKALTSLQILSVDLNRADGATVLPATATRPTLPADSAQPNQALTIPVQFNFSQINSGEYSGILLITYADGELTIPVIVRVKDYWLLPLLVLLLGVALGVGVSAYRSEGRTPDEFHCCTLVRCATQRRINSTV